MGVRERLVNSRAGESVRPSPSFGSLVLENIQAGQPNALSLGSSASVEKLSNEAAESAASPTAGELIAAGGDQIPHSNSDFFLHEAPRYDEAPLTPCYSPKLKNGDPLVMSVSHFNLSMGVGLGTDGSPTVSKWRRCTAAALQIHQDGRELFREGQCLFGQSCYSRANVYFTKAIELQELPEYLSARSMCWLKLNEPALALQDSMQAIERSRRGIEKYLGGDRKRERTLFLEYYYRRGLCFARQGGVMGSQLALHDFKVATTQSNKLGFWCGTNPEGWEQRQTDVTEEYEDETRQIEELDEEERQEYEQGREALEAVLARARLGIVLDEITELKTTVAQEMADSDEYSFSNAWKAMPMNHRTTDLLLPISRNNESISRVFKDIEGGKLLHCADLFGLLTLAREKLLPLDNIVEVTVPEGASVRIIGDIHGQLHDLLHILHLTGLPSEHNIIIFNGDFVDRGAYGIECVSVLLLLKVAYPDHFHMVRGNHEDHAVNEQYHFLAELLVKYGSCDLYHAIQAVFKHLPVAHVLNKEVFVVHGGIPGPDVTLQHVQGLDRHVDVPEEGPITNMLWSDPWDEPGEGHSARGRGVLFGPDHTDAFLELNGLKFVVRSHDVTACMETGHASHHSGKCITVFSAPNYCNSFGNKASILNIDHKMNPWFTTFGSTRPPAGVLDKVCNRAALY